jgi:hypothetical protein
VEHLRLKIDRTLVSVVVEPELDAVPVVMRIDRIAPQSCLQTMSSASLFNAKKRHGGANQHACGCLKTLQ